MNCLFQSRLDDSRRVRAPVASAEAKTPLSDASDHTGYSDFLRENSPEKSRLEFQGITN